MNMEDKNLHILGKISKPCKTICFHCDHLEWPNMDWETSVTPCQGAECQNNNSTEHLFFLFIFEETKFVSEDVLLLLPI